MKLLRHIVKHNLANYLFAMVLFAVCWHVFSSYSELSNRVIFFNDQVKTETKSLEIMVRGDNEFGITKLFNSYVSDVVPTIVFDSKINKEFFKNAVVSGNLKIKDGISFKSSQVLEHEGLILGEVVLYFDLVKLNVKVLSKNLLLYIMIAFMFLGFIVLANYNSYKIFTALESSVQDLESNLDVKDVESTLTHLQYSLTKSSNSSKNVELSNILEKIKSLLKRQMELRESAQQNEIISTLSRKVAHDIRSPLSLLKICAASPEKLAQNTEVLESVAIRIEAIAEDLLSKTRSKQYVVPSMLKTNVEEDLTVTTTQGFVVQTALRQVFKEKALEYAHTNIVFNLNILSQKPIIVKGEQHEYKTILSNLINNSVESFPALQKEKIITVKLKQTHAGVEVYISDTGKGMNRELLSRVMLSSVSEGKVRGNGLGLRLAVQKINFWNGLLDIVSSPGKGTSVRVFLHNIIDTKKPSTINQDPTQIVS